MPAKEEWYNKKVKEGFFIFNKNEFPAFTGTAYDPLIFAIINGAYSKNPARFYGILEPHIYFDNGKKDFRIDSRNIEQLKSDLLSDMPLKGLQILEIESKEPGHIEFLKLLGAGVDHNSSIKINEFGAGRITLNNYEDVFQGRKYDITLSNGLLANGPYIRYNGLSGNFCGLELYTIFANLTKKDGLSIHTDGNLITSLFITFFQLVGLQTVEYFRYADGNDKFMLIMKKLNKKVTGDASFKVIYSELKKRNPIRYI